MKGTLFLISGPSAVGKTTLVKLLMAELDSENIKLLVTYTTKQPRENDINGKDYYFITEQDFLDKKSKGFFIESAHVYGNWYGVPASMLDDLQNDISYIAVVDVKGACTLASLYNKYCAIWIDAHDRIIAERMSMRATESQEVQQLRLNKIYEERKAAEDSNIYMYKLINENKEAALSKLMEIFSNHIN